MCRRWREDAIDSWKCAHGFRRNCFKFPATANFQRAQQSHDKHWIRNGRNLELLQNLERLKHANFHLMIQHTRKNFGAS
jgi:hypothetical protein